MSKQQTCALSDERKNTRAQVVDYVKGGKYSSRKTCSDTASFSGAHKYMTFDHASRVSTTFSRSRDKLAEINARLKKIAR